MKSYFFISAALAILLASCGSQPKLSEGGQQVEYIYNPGVIEDKLNDATKCTLVANLEVEAKVTVGVLESSKISEEKHRNIRARNLAAKSGANLIIPDGDLMGNAQRFKAYACK